MSIGAPGAAHDRAVVDLDFAKPPLRGPASGGVELTKKQRALEDAAERFAGLLSVTFVHGVMESVDGLVAEGPGKDVLSGLLEETLANQVRKASTFGMDEAVKRRLQPVPSDPAPLSAEARILDKVTFLPLEK